MRKILRAATLQILTASGFLHGCALVIPRTYADPEEITLKAALADVACSLKTYQNELAKLDYNTGQIIDEVTVNFKIKGSATGQSTLVVDTSKAAAPVASLPIGVSYSDGLTTVGERNNEITLKFKNLNTAVLNKAGEAAFLRAGTALGARPTDLYPRAEPCDPLSTPLSTQIAKQMREKYGN